MFFYTYLVYPFICKCNNTQCELKINVIKWKNKGKCFKYSVEFEDIKAVLSININLKALTKLITLTFKLTNLKSNLKRIKEILQSKVEISIHKKT